LTADPVGDAVAASQTVTRAKLKLTLSTGRLVEIDVPADATDAELLELAANLYQVRLSLEAQRRPTIALARMALPKIGR